MATRVGSIPEIFGPAADELVVPGAPGALAQAIEDMVAHPRRITAGVAAHRDWLRPRFHIEAMQGEVEGLYRKVLARKWAGRA